MDEECHEMLEEFNSTSNKLLIVCKVNGNFIGNFHFSS